MAQQLSVTTWLQLLKVGDRDEAVNRLWSAYFGRLVGLARRHLKSRQRPVADEEDLALSAFDSFVRAAQAGAFPRLDNRDDLWQVLCMLTARKTIDLIQRENALKAGGGRVVQLSALRAGEGSDSPAIDFPADEPDPAEAVAMAEGLQQMLGLLDSGELQKVVVWRMEGHTNEEIAAKLGRSVATVERKLKTIREVYRAAGIWVEETRDNDK